MPGFEDAPREVLNSRNHGQLGAARAHPMIIVAATAVTLFSVVGIGVLTGLIPNAHSENRPATPAVLPTVAGAAQAPIGTYADAPPPATAPTKASPTPPAREAKANTVTSSKEPKVTSTGSAAPVPRYESGRDQPSSGRERSTASTTSTSSSAANGAPNNSRTVSTRPDASTAVAGGNGVVVSTNVAQTGNVVATKAEPQTLCANCGTVDSINKVSEPGQGSGVGAVIGGVVGGAIGRQMGNGRGRDVATVAGAVAGGLIGNQVEKNGKTSAHYEVRVKLEDGSYQTVRLDTEPAVRVGDRVRIERGRVERVN